MGSHTHSATFATLPKTERGRPIVLGGDPKGKNFLYTNGNSIIIRDIANPAVCDIYTQHQVNTTVAKYSPSGFYICSGDVSGKVRIWDTTQKEHILKNEYPLLGGRINDIAWSEDSQRIVVGGDGREKFGAVINMDTGTTVGEIMGQSKPINACDFRPSRPFRVVTASEDTTIAYFEGPPFKFKKSLHEHSRFVNCVRYSAVNGDVFISGGAEGKAFIYDGKTGEIKGELGSPAHKGGIYGLSFNTDGSKLLTVSGDKSAKIWDVETTSVVTEFPLGTAVEDMQVGCLWQNEHVLSVSLSGHINYLDQNNPSTPIRVIKGHNKPITSMALDEDHTSVFTGSSDGIICHWNLSNGENDVISGKGHSNQVQDMATDGDDLVSCGMDDTLVFTSISGKCYSESLKLPSQPRSVAAACGGLVLVACINEVVVVRNRHIVYCHKVRYEPTCVAIHPGMTEVAVGGGGEKENNIYVYNLSGDTLTDARVLEESKTELTDLRYSPDGAILAATDSNRKLHLYRNYECLTAGGLSHHSARVKCLSWSPDCTHLATGALDTNVIVWSPDNTRNVNTIKGAHPMNQVNRLEWIDANRLVTAGQDSCVRLWDITHA